MRKFNNQDQCFPTFFWLATPLPSDEDIWWHPSCFNGYKDQGIVTAGDTPGTSSRHPSVPRHPGWESLG